MTPQAIATRERSLPLFSSSPTSHIRFDKFRCQQAWLNSCSMRPTGPFVVIVVFVVCGGKPADVLLAVVSGISIHVVTLASIPIQLVSVSREAH